MKLVGVAILVLVLALVITPRAARAASACNGADGWSPPAATVVPPHAHLVFWTDRPRIFDKGKLIAKIDGKPVAIKTTNLAAAPYKLIEIEIDSKLTGELEIGTTSTLVKYTIAATASVPREVHATTSRYHLKIPHTTVREVFDGLAIRLDTPAILAHVKIRRDDKAPWSELDVPVTLDDGHWEIRLGELGCSTNYTVGLLETGVDLGIDVTLADGSRVHVKDLSHVALPRLAKPTSDVPSVAE